jgi:hypothetical protein
MVATRYSLGCQKRHNTKKRSSGHVLKDKDIQLVGSVFREYFLRNEKNTSSNEKSYPSNSIGSNFSAIQKKRGEERDPKASTTLRPQR